MTQITERACNTQLGLCQWTSNFIPFINLLALKVTIFNTIRSKNKKFSINILFVYFPPLPLHFFHSLVSPLHFFPHFLAFSKCGITLSFLLLLLVVPVLSALSVFSLSLSFPSSSPVCSFSSGSSVSVCLVLYFK